MKFTWRWLLRWYKVSPGIPISFITVFGVASAAERLYIVHMSNSHLYPFITSVSWLYTVYSLSAPPNWLTASMNLAWRSGVHFNLGLASVESTSPESPDPFPVWRNICLEEEWMFFAWFWWLGYILPTKPISKHPLCFCCMIHHTTCVFILYLPDGFYDLWNSLPSLESGRWNLVNDTMMLYFLASIALSFWLLEFWVVLTPCDACLVSSLHKFFFTR